MKRSPMPARKTPLRSTSTLARTGGPQRRSSLRPVSKAQRSKLAAYKPVHAAALDRDGHACVVCAATADLHVHHRQGRGSRLLDLDLLVTLCAVHHAHVHANVAESYANGLLLRRVGGQAA